MSEPAPITAEQVQAYLASQAAARLAEEEAIFHALEAWLKERGAEIVCVIQPIQGGAGAVPVWGVRKVGP